MATELSRSSLAMLAASLVFTSSAATARTKQEPKDNWGEAFRQTMAAQIIDPNPQYDTAVPKSSGEHAAAASERYRTDKVKRPDKVSSSSVGRQASGGSSSNN